MSALIIGLDYGTTYTGVAVIPPKSAQNFSLADIELVDVWGERMGNHNKIPSVISFSAPSREGEEQWGSDLSDDAIAMVHTKLELDLQEVQGELNLMLHALRGMKDLHFDELKKMGALPAYSDQTAEQIVTAYLTRVFESASEVLSEYSQAILDRTPVVIVITVPTEWSYRAMNSTYKAALQAGFNDKTFPRLSEVIFVTEPEAAAIYTARYLREDKRISFLKQDECFVLCDAGGGTVDVVSYRVKQVGDTLDLERIGLPTGDKCGSIHIDHAFKAWLRELIGDKNYAKLNGNAEIDSISSHTTEGKHMRVLMKKFEGFKKDFHKDSRDMFLPLPDALDNIHISGKIEGGEVKITNEVMTEFFQTCVAKIMELIETQMRAIRDMNKRVMNIFLVGGFGESQFLQAEIELSLKLRNGITLRVPDTSWTAVVRGAALCGLERDKVPNLSVASSCPRSYGISWMEPYSNILHDEEDRTNHNVTGEQIAAGQMTWLIKKGDLILSDKPQPVTHIITEKFFDSSPKDRKLIIWSYEHHDHLPAKIKGTISELRESHVLEYNLADIPKKELEKRRSNNRSYYIARLKLTMTVSAKGLNTVLEWKDNQLGEGSELW